ncbi:MAG TPA: MFS transporter, partial [Candidatus Eisenbacteria bacterium]|nr:MFS transporter [Candidatus Eisenbacteria bacterium]
ITVGTLALVGVLFTMPQYFQGVQGFDAMGSGLGLLPLIAGFVVGLAPAARLVRLAGAKITVALGFAVLAAGWFVGATTSLESSGAFVAAWMAGAGIGFGLLFATAASAALSELPVDRSGIGSAVLQALKNTGAPLGAAILGSVLSSTYQTDLHPAGLPPAAARAVEGSVFGGLAVASQLHSAALLESVRAAFVHGIDAALVVSAGIAIAGMLIAVAFLPGRAAVSGASEPVSGEGRRAATG